MSQGQDDGARARARRGIGTGTGGTRTGTGTGTGTGPRVRAALAVVAACIGAAALYAVLRIAQKILFQEPDPALVLWSEHAGYYWRVWTALYGGGTAGFVAWVTAGRDAARTARVLATALVVSTLLLTAQGALVP